MYFYYLKRKLWIKLFSQAPFEASGQHSICLANAGLYHNLGAIEFPSQALGLFIPFAICIIECLRIFQII